MYESEKFQSQFVQDTHSEMGKDLANSNQYTKDLTVQKNEIKNCQNNEAKQMQEPFFKKCIE